MDIPGIKHRIIKHLPAYLLKYGSVDLAGLGRFQLDARTSFIDYGALLVFPPYYDVVFEETQATRAQDYVSYLSKRLGLDDSLISEVMVAYVTTIRQQLTHGDIVSMEGLGDLQRAPGNSLNFDSDKQFWGQEAVANLAIRFEPVPRIKEMAEKQPVTPLENGVTLAPVPGEEDFLELKEDLLENVWDDNLVDSDLIEEAVDEVDTLKVEVSEDETLAPNVDYVVVNELPADNTRVELPLVRTDELVDTTQQSKNHRRIVPLMVGLLLLAIPLFWYLTRGDDHEQSGDKMAIEVPDDRLNKNPQETVDGKAAIESSNTEPKEEALLLPSTKADSERIADTPRASKENEIKKSVEPESLPKKIENIKPGNSIKKTNSSVSSGDCVIIVGAFGEGPNMRQMMSRLESRGFKVYVDSTRSLSRVGVYSTCRNDELLQNLSIIQSDIEPKSWILNRN